MILKWMDGKIEEKQAVQTVGELLLTRVLAGVAGQSPKRARDASFQIQSSTSSIIHN